MRFKSGTRALSHFLRMWRRYHCNNKSTSIRHSCPQPVWLFLFFRQNNKHKITVLSVRVRVLCIYVDQIKIIVYSITWTNDFKSHEKTKRKKKNISNVRRFSCSIFGIEFGVFFPIRAPTCCQSMYFEHTRLLMFTSNLSLSLSLFQFKIDDNWILAFLACNVPT